MSSIENMRAKHKKEMEKHIKAAGKAVNNEEYVTAARDYEAAAKWCISSGDTEAYDNLVRLSSDQYRKAAEKYAKEKMQSHLIYLYYKDAARMLEKANNKSPSDMETISHLLKLSEQLILRTVSDSEEAIENDPSRSQQITENQYRSLSRVATDEELKKSAGNKAFEEHIKNIESHNTIPKIFGVNLSAGAQKEAIERGILSKEEFIGVMGKTMKEIERDTKLKLYTVAAYKSLNIAESAAKCGYPDTASELASKSLELYKTAEKALKKKDYTGASKINESIAKVYNFLGQKDAERSAIKSAVHMYLVEAEIYTSKKKWLAALPSLEQAHKLAQKYEMRELLAEIEANINNAKNAKK